MRGVHYNRFLAGTALALVWGASVPALSQGLTNKDFEAALPVVEPAPFPTDAELGAGSAPKAPAATPAASAPAAAAPAAPVAADAAPAIDPAVLKTLTGKDLVKAPIASNLSAADAAVAEKLRDLLATKADRYFSRKTERTAAEVFYRDRGFAPLWIDRGAPSAKATQAIAYLRGVAVDGLFPEDYPTPEFKPGDPDSLADTELKYGTSVLAYARHARTGRVSYTRVSADILYPNETPDPAAILDGVAGQRTIAETLSSYLPQHPGYKALKAKLAEVRAAKGGNAPARIEGGPVLKIAKTKVKGKAAQDVFMTDPRVPILRERLGVAAKSGDDTYDAELADAVKKFQGKHGLAANGVVNSSTLDAINGPRHDRDAEIIVANMERWRWLPHDLGRAYVILNIPDYTLRVMKDGAQVWTTRVVTGKPGKMATPMLTETMKFITVNPTWNVPPSIINNEYLPALQQDPDALERIGLKMETSKDGTVRIYQPPGAANALGRIRFNFPNKFLVYQHDTPDKYLFEKFPRAYSHGCMRVQFPDKYAEVLLGISNPKDGYTAERIQKMYGSGETNINLNTPIPVHITYQTAFVDDAGHLQLRDDVYGRDAALLPLLKDDARKTADIPIERREISEKPPVAKLPQQENSFMSFFQRQNNMRRVDPRFGGRRSVQNDDSFFGRLFR